MSIRSDLQNKDFVITAELNPPKSYSLFKMVEHAIKVRDYVSAINITDNSGATVKLSSIVASHIIKRDCGTETIWQTTCRDKNRIALQSDLLAAWALGIQNILPLRGDNPTQGDYSNDIMSFDLQTEEFIALISKMKTGFDYTDKPLKPFFEGDLNFCIAAAAHPGLPDLTAQRERMKRRLELGVEFFQTQICLDIHTLRRFRDSLSEDLVTKTLIGITPLKTLRQAEFIEKNIWGVDIAEAYMKRMQEANIADNGKDIVDNDAQFEAGLAIAKEIVDETKSLGFKGVHVMAIGQESRLDKIIKTIC